ncbi:protein turtle [Elysia marginata]|uniref:Protein turtle n=1 Tax=Elysia marginata TaxID=1093978 RepID=A0AAV4H3U9_9GAST|nr:protein turtle [Elysia marginata]
MFYQYAPEVFKINTEVTWAKGYNGQLDCPADSNPPLTLVKWQRNQDVLESKGRFDILKNGTLLVSPVKDSDAGHYQCTPHNDVGAGPASPRIHVQVKDPPYFVASPKVRYIKNVGDTVRIPCEARGLPSVITQWIKVGGYLDLMSDRVSKTNSYLEIRNLTKNDHGRYECRAINNIATVVKVTDLRIDKTTPHAPFNVTVTPGTFNVTITWEPAHDGGTTQQYTLWFRRRNQVMWNHMKVSPPGATHNRLYSLQPNTVYEFKVVSTNYYGNSTFSETVTQRTLGNTLGSPHPPSPPLPILPITNS